MPLAKLKNAEGLSFEFDQPKPQYCPGDTLSGRVVLNTADDAALGRVTVTFYGRSKSRIIQHHGQSTSVHRSRAKFFEFEYLLYEGQYTHKPGSFSWPFNFTVPAEASPESLLEGEKFKPKDNYVSNADPTNLDLSLPASTYNSHSVVGRQVELYIEYVLEASITEPEGLHHIRKAQTKTSYYPINFRPLSTPTPITDFQLITTDRKVTISSLKLLPEHAGTSLGIRDRARSIFSRDTIPKFAFNVQVEAPTVLQTFHPSTIPLFVTASLVDNETTLDPNIPPPKIIIRSVNVALRVGLFCRAYGTWSDSKHYTIPLVKDKVLNHPLPLSSSLPGSEKLTSQSEATKLNLGELCDVRLANAKIGSRIESPLVPSFTTYNLSRSFQLYWQLEIECGEKTEKIESKAEFFTRTKGPTVQVIGPPGDGSLESGGYSEAIGDGDDVLAAEEEGSGSGMAFWRRKSGESSRGEKEKPPILSSEVTGESARERKEREAMEERQRAETGDAPPSFESVSGNPFTTETGRDSKKEDALPLYQP